MKVEVKIGASKIVEAELHKRGGATRCQAQYTPSISAGLGTLTPQKYYNYRRVPYVLHSGRAQTERTALADERVHISI